MGHVRICHEGVNLLAKGKKVSTTLILTINRIHQHISIKTLHNSQNTHSFFSHSLFLLSVHSLSLSITFRSLLHFVTNFIKSHRHTPPAILPPSQTSTTTVTT